MPYISVEVILKYKYQNKSFVVNTTIVIYWNYPQQSCTTCMFSPVTCLYSFYVHAVPWVGGHMYYVVAKHRDMQQQ